MEVILNAAPPVWVVAAVTVVVIFSAIIQAGLGMGFGLMAAPLLALFAPELVPVPTLWMGFVTSVFAAWADRTGVVWSEVGLGMVGRVAGVAVAVGILGMIGSGPMFFVIFGLMVGLAVALSLSGLRVAFNRVSLLGMAWVSGLMATITSVGAPPMAVIYQDRSAREARPTLAAFFALGVAASLAGLHLSGHAGWREVGLAALMVPPMLLGTWIGRRMRGRFDRRFRTLMLAVSGAAAVLLVLRGLTWTG